MVGIDRQKLPRTLKDALYICERLRISYLWVVSLCIIQDSEDDWQLEAAKMSGIYLGSLLTLSFSSALSAESGCFNENSIHALEFVRLRKSWATLDGTLSDGRKSRLYIPSSRGIHVEDDPTKTFQKEVLAGPLSERAWVLQEHVLPRRTLYFTSKQLFWECQHCRLSEDNYPQDQLPFFPICDLDFTLDAGTIVSLWYCKIVVEYMHRKLTRETDRLVAMAHQRPGQSNISKSKNRLHCGPMEGLYHTRSSMGAKRPRQEKQNLRLSLLVMGFAGFRRVISPRAERSYTPNLRFSRKSPKCFLEAQDRQPFCRCNLRLYRLGR
ncbi:heterokaryon incompatibility protein [Colletotrichum plurivorum]|uniref:Heterokaryon incompatibility protein n=1 Tax=Colletotrichum plurivorum TaxID=2175906 RepID=A0A8H6KCG8_9PEZI|nr:heterokaryon incompatibility protein [Colletotrichum plurivorum]